AASSTPCAARSKARRKGEAHAIGCTAEQRSKARSAESSGSRTVRAPPPIVGCASSTRTPRPARASVTAAARPLGPEPTTTASSRVIAPSNHDRRAWGRRDGDRCGAGAPTGGERPRAGAAARGRASSSGEGRGWSSSTVGGSDAGVWVPAVLVWGAGDGQVFPTRRPVMSERANLLCLRTLLPLPHLVLDVLPLIEGPVTVGLDRAVVNKKVLAAGVRGDEPVPLLGVEPLDGALGHA